MPVGFLAIAAAFGAAVMLLWNCLMPTIAGLGVINFWQAVGLLVLCRILFGNCGWHHCHGMHGGKHHGNHMHSKWAAMSEEQKREFINRRMEHMDCSPFGWKRSFCGGKPKTERADDAVDAGE